MTNIESALQSEVVAMHDFLAAWFRGDEAKDRAHFKAHLIDRFDQNLRIIYPSGRMLTRAELFDPIFAAHASNPPFRVAIRSFKLITLSQDNELATACYIEDQFNALSSNPADNSRYSTVVFRITPDRKTITWVHIHETAIG